MKEDNPQKLINQKLEEDNAKVIGQTILTLSLIKDSKNPHVRKGLVVNLEVCESLLRRKIWGLHMNKWK